MLSIWTRLKALFVANEPAIIAWSANGGIALIVSYLTPLPHAEVGAITIITTALAGIYTAATTRPVAVSVITSALSTIATAVGFFGLHLPSADVTAGLSILSVLLGLLTRQAVTPAVRLRRPTPPPVVHAAA